MSKDVREKFEAFLIKDAKNLGIPAPEFVKFENNGKFLAYENIIIDQMHKCYKAAHAESAARIAELEQKINALKVKAHEAEMMAECTVMLRDDLIQAGIIKDTVPPMFMTEAILGHIQAITNTGDNQS